MLVCMRDTIYDSVTGWPTVKWASALCVLLKCFPNEMPFSNKPFSLIPSFSQLPASLGLAPLTFNSTHQSSTKEVASNLITMSVCTNMDVGTIHTHIEAFIHEDGIWSEALQM